MEKPIGFFDSGIGGLNVLAAAKEALPEENYVYLGDDANAPYGIRSESEVLALTLSHEGFFRSKNIKALVVACNTATSAAVVSLRERLNVPVISMEPAVKPGIGNLEKGKCLVIATRTTINGEKYLRLLSKFNGSNVISIVGEGWVELIETLDFEGQAVKERVREVLSPCNGQMIDSIVLGCTHYPFIKRAIEEYAEKYFLGKRTFFDGIDGTVKRLKTVLEENRLRGCGEGQIELFSTAGEEKGKEYAQLLHLVEQL